MKEARKYLLGLFFFIGAAFAFADEPPLAALPLATPLEAVEYQKLPSSREVNQYLQQLAEASPYIVMHTQGRSAGKRPFPIVLVSKEPDFLLAGKLSKDKATVMLVASQHGDEPSGSEAVQILLREIAGGKYPEYLDNLNLVVVPLANPDGRDNGLVRYNDNNVDINRDFVVVDEEETRLIIDAMNQYQPHATLDIHEASAFKKVLSGQEGYLTNYQTQVEMSTNPNVDVRLREFSQHTFLPALIEAINEQGGQAQQYRGFISALNQPFVRASLHARVFRNYASLRGSVSALLENRLDPPTGDYSTPENIAERVAKQKVGVLAFLNEVLANKDDIIALVSSVRSGWVSNQDGTQRIMLVSEFGLDRQQAVVDIPLIDMATDEEVWRPFVNYSAIISSKPLNLPEAYAVTNEQAVVSSILDKHRIHYDIVDETVQYYGRVQALETLYLKRPPNESSRFDLCIELTEYDDFITLEKGDLVVPTDQAMAVFLPLILDPRSTSSLFQVMHYRPLLLKYSQLFIFPINLSEVEFSKQT